MYLIVYLCTAWLAGIWLAEQIYLPWWGWLCLALGAGAALAVFRRGLRLRAALACALVLAVGGARYQLALPVYDKMFLASYNDVGTVTLEGVVLDEPDVREARVNLRVGADRLLLPNATVSIPVHGLALVSAPRFSASRLAAAGAGEFHYGDRLVITGTLTTPPVFEDFSYKDYLARQDVYSQIRLAQIGFSAARQASPVWQALFDFKARALAVLAQIFPEPHAALLSGILLGVDSGIPSDLKNAFSTTGTSHIVAISGFNIALIAGLFAVFANRLFGKRRGAIVAIVGIVAYTVLVGASASVVRAAIMGSLALVAQQLGRRTLGLNTLAVAAIGMTLFNPLTLWDVGFQLSAMATLGLVLYAEPFEAAFEKCVARFVNSNTAKKTASLASELVLLTCAAQVTTLPLMAYYFKSVSLIALLANVVILPAQPAVMILAGLALLAGLIVLPLGKLLAWVAWPFSAYTIAFVEFFAKFPAASLALDEVAPWVIAGFYIMLFGLTWWLSRPPEQRPAWPQKIPMSWLTTAGLGALAVGALLAWGFCFSLPDGRLKVVVLDVGQGDAILIQTPSGEHVLLDGGPSGGVLTRALDKQLPLFSRQIDLLIIAAPRDESVGGLPDVLARYQVKRVVVTGAPPGKSVAYQAVLNSLRDSQIEQVSAVGLPVFDLGDDIQLRVIFDGENGSGLRLDWRRASILLPIGLRLADETNMLMHGGLAPATALFVADSGSTRATQEKWVWAIDPQVIMLSAGANNAAGLPAPEILERLAERTILRTDVNGTIMLLTDGERLWVEGER